MSDHREALPRGLRRQIYSYGAFIMLAILTTGCLMGIAIFRSIQTYQKAMTQLAEIYEVKTEINRISGLLQNRIVTGEENEEECRSAWVSLTKRIGNIEFQDSEAERLLAKNFKDFQKNTAADFYLLLGGEEPESIYSRYQEFLAQQEDRQFLSDMLLGYLSQRLVDDYPLIVQENGFYLLVFAAVLVCLMLITGVFSYIFARNICDPIWQLVSSTKELMEGDYQIADLPVDRYDEIGYLTVSFNEMKKRIQESFQNQEELWKLESLLQDAEFRALQSQVNPHFLFNVLGVATETALVENADQTVDIIEHISYMLRYSLLSVREDAWLEDELKMVRAYVFLQQKRFGDRITFLLSVPVRIPAVRVPGMTLQPIVENAVMHGVEHMTAGGKIEVILTESGGCVEICVRDNGRGIPSDKLQALNAGEYVRDGDRSTGIGLANVSNRLAMFYRRPGLLRIESRAEKGTAVYLKYCTLEETPNVSDSDC